MHFQHAFAELCRDFRTIGILRQRESASARLWISSLPVLLGKPPKKNRFKRFCASSISLSGFHVVTLFNVFIYFTFWIELKPCWYIALTAYCQSRPESCVH